MTLLLLGPVHTYTSKSPSQCSFVQIASDSYLCNSYEWSIHVDLYESEVQKNGKIGAFHR